MRTFLIVVASIVGAVALLGVFAFWTYSRMVGKWNRGG